MPGNYVGIIENKDKRILSLLVDITSPKFLLSYSCMNSFYGDHDLLYTDLLLSCNLLFKILLWIYLFLRKDYNEMIVGSLMSSIIFYLNKCVNKIKN